MTTHDATIGLSDESILKDLASKLPATPNARKRRIWIACLVVGAAALGYLFLTEPDRAWGAWAINTLFFLGIAQGGVVLAAAIRLTNGKWGGPIMRLGEAMSAYMPMGFATMLVLLLFGIWSYLPWTSHPDERLAPFLNVPFLYIRTLGGILLFWYLANKLVKQSLRMDAHKMAPYVPAALKGVYEKLSENWQGDEAEQKRYNHEVSHLSPQIVLTFVVFFSVIGWDFIMILTPHWISALFGWFVYAAAFLSGVCMVAFIATQVRTKYNLEPYINSDHFWDIGKVVFAFAIFWVYLFWSQYLPIWYANMPEETGYVFLRFEEPWRPWAFAVFFMIFVIPFLGMLNKTSKANPMLLMSFTLLIMAGVWLERHVLVMPSLNPDTVWIGLAEVGVGIGFIGLFGWMIQGFLTRYPSVKVVDVLAHYPRPEH